MPLTSTADATAPPLPRPFREGLLSVEPASLLGSKCAACGTVAFPAREFCAACRSVEGLEEVTLDAAGVVHSFTVVRQAPPGVEVPYVLAWIDLPGDGVRLMATVSGIEPERVELGMPVELELTPFGTADDGAELLGFRFRPAGVAA
jgi:uncharacterized OB-fold protein